MFPIINRGSNREQFLKIIVKTCSPRCGGLACPLMDTKNCLSFLLPLNSPIRVVLTPLPETFPLYTKFYYLYRLISTSRLDSSPSFILSRSPELQWKESKESPLLHYGLDIYLFTSMCFFLNNFFLIGR